MCVAAVAVLALASLPTRSAAAAEATAWARSAHSAARLIDAGAAAAGVSREPGARLAGLEIRLDPAFITYWRDPGDAGVPPSFDFTGSTNLKSAEVSYPAPGRLNEAGAVAFGYTGDVTFPIAVVPVDPAEPVRLHLGLAYAACHDICLPAHATLAIELGGSPSAEASRVDDALAAVPRPAALGEHVGPLALLGVAPAAAGGLEVETEAPDGSTLFVEGGDAFAFTSGVGAPTGGGRLVFPVKRVDGPAGAPTPPLTLTLVAPGDPARAIEVRAKLDAGAQTP